MNREVWRVADPPAGAGGRSPLLVLVLIGMFAGAATARTGVSMPGDEALVPHLERAELALRGKILSFPRGRRGEAEGPTRYRVDFLVYDVLKGDDDVKNRILKVDIERYEADRRDPEIAAGRKRILLVRKLDPGRRVFTTVDPWFGTLPDHPRLAGAIRVLSGKTPGTEEAEIYRKARD